MDFAQIDWKTAIQHALKVSKKLKVVVSKPYHLSRAITPKRLKLQKSGWSHLKELSKCLKKLMNPAQID